MLARFQNAVGRNDLIEQMVLLPEPKNSFVKVGNQASSVNLIVGYNASPNSHTALDIAFWIAHQTRLATNAEVTVQAVYVVEDYPSYQYTDTISLAENDLSLEYSMSNVTQAEALLSSSSKVTAIATKLRGKSLAPIKQADRILWQAKSLAEEWQGSFKSHLRFGCMSQELKKVVELESADILFLGCQSINHALIEALGADFPCTVLGIPLCIDE